jgi:hypothetical protein
VNDTLASSYLDDVKKRFHRLKSQVETALAQVGDDAFFAAHGPHGNSLAVLVKHIAGNMRSRWRDPFTTDGEKPDRHRDTEFVLAPDDTRESLMARWDQGWGFLLGVLDALRPEDLTRTVTIRGEGHLVVEALNRQLAHYAYHTGQVVLLAKALSGETWQWMSIPPGESERFNAQMQQRAGR